MQLVTNFWLLNIMWEVLHCRKLLRVEVRKLVVPYNVIYLSVSFPVVHQLLVFICRICQVIVLPHVKFLCFETLDLSGRKVVKFTKVNFTDLLFV